MADFPTDAQMERIREILAEGDAAVADRCLYREEGDVLLLARSHRETGQLVTVEVGPDGRTIEEGAG